MLADETVSPDRREQNKARTATYRTRHPDRVKAARAAYRERERAKKSEEDAAVLADRMRGLTPSDYPPVITRAEAQALGRSRYFPGPGYPCKRGHIAERRTSTRACLECAKGYEAAYKAKCRRDNPEKVKAYFTAYRASNLEKTKKWQAESRLRHIEKSRAREKAYRVNNPDKIRETQAAYRTNNIEKMRAHWRKRRALKAGAEGFHTAKDIEDIYSRQNGKCACCKKKVGDTYDVDHIVALSKGGSNWPANLQILCPTCNRTKRDKDPIAFMQSMGFLL
jgi:5-methylcytosine-specific restriction endonuclease McrA